MRGRQKCPARRRDAPVVTAGTVLRFREIGALRCSDVPEAVGCMLERPEHPALLAHMGSDNATGADNQQETRENVGILRDCTPTASF
jgi:hypothetical protein